MQIILLERISKLGNIGDQVNVKSGYARNYLIPRKMAVSATKANIEYFNSQKAAFEAEFNRKVALSNAIAEKITALSSITLPSKSGDQGRLFGSIGARDIVAVLASHDITVEKSEVRIPNSTIRTLGSYEVSIHLHGNITTTLNVEVIAE